jgi:serine/threonine-protein kinase
LTSRPTSRLPLPPLEGETLSARLLRVGKLTPRETAALLEQVGRAVTKSHAAGIVHRDLKPDNLLITADAGAETVKLLDFGVATTPTPHVDSLTATGDLLGTPYYMSPEQAEGTRRVDHRSDLWALGVIAFECLLGRRPFQGQSFSEVILAICKGAPPIPSSLGPVPAGFDAWFARACAKDPESRFENARELTARLCAVAEDPRPAPASPDAEAAVATLAVSSLESLETIALPTTGAGLARSATLPAAQPPPRHRPVQADWFAIALCGGAMLLGACLFAVFHHWRTLAPPVAPAATEPPAVSAPPRVPPTVSAQASAIPGEVPRVPFVAPVAAAPRSPQPARSARPAPVKRAPRQRPSTDLGF